MPAGRDKNEERIIRSLRSEGADLRCGSQAIIYRAPTAGNSPEVAAGVFR